MKKGNPAPLPPELAAELRTLEQVPDETIDTSDIPERRGWPGAVRGQFFRPVQRRVSF